MTNSNHISELWQTLEEEKNIGLVKRLYSSDIQFHIFATFQYPERYYGIAFTFGNDNRIDISSFDNLRELKVMLVSDTTFVDSRLLIIQLLHSNSRDIFATLCNNLVHSVIQLNSEQKIIRTVINQLEKWQTLFEKMKGEGLTTAEQLGLYGELHLLQKLINKQNAFTALTSWVGSDKEIRDFQYNDWAIEVKATASNNHQRISINSERQLDETLLENLFLFHLSVETSNKNGESLYAKINAIRVALQDNASALNSFNNKLLEVGFFEKHIHLYEKKCYQIRNENFYKIDGDFPRIKEKEIRDGVGNVKYSIIISQCNKYLISENALLNKINIL